MTTSPRISAPLQEVAEGGQQPGAVATLLEDLIGPLEGGYTGPLQMGLLDVDAVALDGEF